MMNPQKRKKPESHLHPAHHRKTAAVIQIVRRVVAAAVTAVILNPARVQVRVTQSKIFRYYYQTEDHQRVSWKNSHRKYCYGYPTSHEHP